MDKKTVILTIFAIILGSLAFVAIFGKSGKTKIEEEIVSANYCRSSADCSVVSGQCPFGCYLPVNKIEAGRIESLVNNYESNCVYSCVVLEGVECIESKCVLKY